LDRAFKSFKDLADRKKEVYDEDLIAIVTDEATQTDAVYQLEYLHVISGTGVIPSATVKLKKDGESYQDSGVGDGPVDAALAAIGREVTPEAVRVLRAVGTRAGVTFEFEQALIGGSAIDATDRPLPSETLALCRRADAILFGAVGGPKWDSLPQEQRAERGLLALRKELDLYANLRPAMCFPMLIDASPLKRAVVEGTDLMVIRELTGGLYFGEPRGRES